MGQKVNPHGARVGVIFDWSTRWYAGKKDFANNLVVYFRSISTIRYKTPIFWKHNIHLGGHP